MTIDYVVEGGVEGGVLGTAEQTVEGGGVKQTFKGRGRQI